MRINQSIDEIGLEKCAIAAWAEPRRGQRMKPKFGSRPFPKKLLYVLLIIACYFGYVLLFKRHSLSIQAALLPIGFVIAWPTLILIDRMQKRNVWVYQDTIWVTHARDRIVLPRSELQQIILYREQKYSMLAMELLSNNGQSTVVALPAEMVVADLLMTLRNFNYSVKSEL